MFTDESIYPTIFRFRSEFASFPIQIRNTVYPHSNLKSINIRSNTNPRKIYVKGYGTRKIQPDSIHLQRMPTQRAVFPHIDGCHCPKVTVASRFAHAYLHSDHVHSPSSHSYNPAPRGCCMPGRITMGAIMEYWYDPSGDGLTKTCSNHQGS
jgi:hypothetical protein